MQRCAGAASCRPFPGARRRPRKKTAVPGAHLDGCLGVRGGGKRRHAPALAAAVGVRHNVGAHHRPGRPAPAGVRGSGRGGAGCAAAMRPVPCMRTAYAHHSHMWWASAASEPQGAAHAFASTGCAACPGPLPAQVLELLPAHAVRQSVHHNLGAGLHRGRAVGRGGGQASRQTFSAGARVSSRSAPAARPSKQQILTARAASMHASMAPRLHGPAPLTATLAPPPPPPPPPYRAGGGPLP